MRDVPFRVFAGVGMWKGVAQVEPDVAIVCVAGDRIRVFGFRGPEDARRCDELHVASGPNGA